MRQLASVTIGVVKEGPALLASTACSPCGSGKGSRFLEKSFRMFPESGEIFCCDAKGSFYECLDYRMIPETSKTATCICFSALVPSFVNSVFPLSIESDTGQRGPLYFEKK